MAIAQGLVINDNTLAIGKQSAKGTQATVLKSCFGFQKAKIEPVHNVVKGETFMGGGFYPQKDLPYGVEVKVTASGWFSLDTLPSMLLTGLANKGTTTGTTAKTHPFAPFLKNINKNYLTIGLIYGDGVSGVGTSIQKVVVRDCVLTNFSFSMAGTDAGKWTASWEGINLGPGTGSETWTPNTSFYIPDPNNAVNTLTWPSFVIANTCPQEFSATWAATVLRGAPCFGLGESSDIYITEALWSFNVKLQYDTNSKSAWEQINYLSNSPTAGTSALVPGLKEGAVALTINSRDVIPTTATPFSFAMSWPSIQWTKADITDDNPLSLMLEGHTFGSDQTFTIVNDLDSSGMSI